MSMTTVPATTPPTVRKRAADLRVGDRFTSGRYRGTSVTASSTASSTGVIAGVRDIRPGRVYVLLSDSRTRSLRANRKVRVFAADGYLHT